MQTFELLLNVAGLLTIGLLWTGRRYLHLRKPALLLLLVLLLVHCVAEIPRWQMAFFYLWLMVSAFPLARSTRPMRPWLRWVGGLSGLFCVLTSIMLSWQTPIPEMPTPSGNYSVGHSQFTVTDPNRPEVLTGDREDHRELFVEVWYPANAPGNAARMTLWAELYQTRTDLIGFLTAYLRGTDTHSFTNATPGPGPFPLVFFNHGLQLFSSQNTLLMEHLASHGYVVVSIGHPYESLKVNLADGRTVIPDWLTSMAGFRQAQEWVAESSAPILSAIDSARQFEDRATRASIMLEVTEKAHDLNNRVYEWVLDNQFILDGIKSGKLLAQLQSSIDINQTAVLGMSLGGAVAAEWIKVNPEIKAGVNIDGHQYGKHLSDSLKRPFAMLYSDDGLGVNDFLYLSSQAAYTEYHFKGAKHADFTDMPRVWPIMKMAGQSGQIPPARMNEILNQLVLSFLEKHLKNQAELPSAAPNFPELDIDTRSPQASTSTAKGQTKTNLPWTSGRWFSS